MTNLSEIFIGFFQRLEREGLKKPLSITLENKAFDRLWYENQRSIVNLETKREFIVNELWFYDVHIVRETPRVLEKQ